MDFDCKTPIYIQIMTLIKTDIITGQLKLGEKMPSVRDLAVKYTINPNTASRVYKELEMEGICFTKRGMGTFVTEDEESIKVLKKQMAENIFKEFMKSMEQLGISKEEILEMVRKGGMKKC